MAILSTDPTSTITGMLAVWKSAKIYAPLDAALPAARLETIVRDAEPALIVADADGAAALSSLSGGAAHLLRLDEVDLLKPADPVRRTATAGTPACLMYTSGSTGVPKGIVRSHRNLLHRARCAFLSLAIRPGDRMSLLHSPAFAAGLRDTLAALLNGATLLSFDVRAAGARALAEWIDRERISVLCAVATTFRHLLAELAPGRCLPSVRVVRLGSEPLYRRDVEGFRRHFSPECLLVAGYGASEASGIAEYRLGRDTSLPAERVPAGYPLEGVEILVLGDDGRRLPAGQAGEIAVRSRYLADGYWRRPDLTRAAFLDDPADPSGRIYLTGDVGRLDADGCLQLLGRKDEQVKVRGYRVHPNEIEAALAAHPAVREAAVAARTDAHGATRLAAYIVPTGRPPHSSALRRFLHSRLPSYMVPSVFLTLRALPVTASGKVDRGALPPPPHASSALSRARFAAPRNPLEHQIAAIWEELFGAPSIGAEDDFFELGGDSLLAAEMVAAIEETCGRALSPTVLLEAPTVAALAARILAEDAGLSDPLTALRESGSRAPLFFVHNDHGRGLYTHGLARSLDVDRPVYAVHLHDLRPPLPPTVEAIAASRLAAVRSVRPHGPYVLGGHCKGGLIALEMAQQLRAVGEEVELVALIDTQRPKGRLLALGGVMDDLGRVRERIGERARYYHGRLRAVRRMNARERAEFVMRRLEWAIDGAPPAEQARSGSGHGVAVDFWRAYRRATRRYVPPAYPGRVALFRAEGWAADRPDLGWSGRLPRLEVVVVPGDHHTCITRHVGALGARLEQALRWPATSAVS